jgi:hypothetical protein
MYKLNGLNSIKSDMITEATRNASAAADRFAADSGSKVSANPANSPAQTSPPTPTS